MKKVLVLFIVLLLIPIIAQANDSSMGRKGETVYPLEETDVRMVSEKIYIKYNSHQSSHVTCEFVFENMGEANTVLMGFPAEEKIPIEAMTTVERVRLHNFTADLNGVPIVVTEETALDMQDEYSEYLSWYVFEVPFNEGETVIMTHEYDINFTSFSTGGVMVSYILETGATWGGELGHTIVTFDFEGLNLYGIQKSYYGVFSNSYRYNDGKLIFEKFDYVPDFNLGVYVSAYANQDFAYEEYLGDIDLERIEFFDNSKDMTAYELIEAYNNLSYDNMFMEVLYLNSIFGVNNEPYAPVAEEIVFNGRDDIRVYVKDRNFDSLDKSEIILLDSEGKEIYRRFADADGYSKEYGTIIYYLWVDDAAVREKLINNAVDTIVVNVSDEEGHASTSYFRFATKEKYQTSVKSGIIDDGSQDYVIENPPTSSSFNYIMSAVLLTLIGMILLYFSRRKKRMHSRNGVIY